MWCCPYGIPWDISTRGSWVNLPFAWLHILLLHNVNSSNTENHWCSSEFSHIIISHSPCFCILVSSPHHPVPLQLRLSQLKCKWRLLIKWDIFILKQCHLNITSGTAAPSVYCLLKASVFSDQSDELNSAHANFYSLVTHIMWRWNANKECG